MKQALYHPDHGFYASGKTRTGRGGDFLTPVSIGPVLGELLARQANELHQTLGRPNRIRLIEQGADAGWLARDLLECIDRHYPELAQAVELHLIEPHPRLVEKQRNTLCGKGYEPRHHPRWQDLPEDSEACFFYSCELPDSFPARVLHFHGGNWVEKRVGLQADNFIWQDDIADAPTVSEIRRWHPPEQEGFIWEIRPDTLPWMKSWTEKIRQGFALTLDYGFPVSELISSERRHGTLVALRDHRRSSDPLADPGEQDLTTHVNFTELEEIGKQAGWKNYGLVNLARGLTSLAAPLLNDETKLSETWIRNFRHLTHPSFFGHTHKILVQGKSLPDSFQPQILRPIP